MNHDTNAADYTPGSDPRLVAYLARLRQTVRAQYTPQELARMDEQAEIGKLRRRINEIANLADVHEFGAPVAPTTC